MTAPLFRYLRFAIASSSEERRIDVSEMLFTLFIWFMLVVLSGIGNIISLEQSSIGTFTVVGIAIVSSGALLAFIFRARVAAINLTPFTVFALLIMLPAFTISPQSYQRIILLDLYFVLLVAAPALLHLWSWRFQALSGALAVVAVSLMWLPIGSWVAAHSILLTALSAVLSTLVILVRVRVVNRQGMRNEGLRLLSDAMQERTPQIVWNVMLLQAALFVCLIFFDLAFFNDDTSYTLLCKVYGLIVLVFGSLLVKASDQERLFRVVGFVTVLAGVILSIARIGYVDWHSPLAALPLVYIALVATMLPWRLEAQVALVWGLILSDLLIKLLAIWDWWLSPFSSFAVVLEMYRGETALLLVGCVGSVLLARTLQHYRVRHLSRYVSVAPESEEPSSVESSGGPRGHRVEYSAAKSLEPMMRQRLVIGLLFVGIVSCAMSSKLLLLYFASNWLLALSCWVSFLTLWAGLVYLEQKAVNKDYFWVFGAFVILVLLLFPCALLVDQHGGGSLWLIWPGCYGVAIASFAWNRREFLPLMFIGAVAAIELMYQLPIPLWGGSLFVLAAVSGAFYSLRGGRILKEKYLLHPFTQQVSREESAEGVVRLLANFMVGLFDARSSLCSVAEGSLEILRDEECIELRPEQWPIRELWEQLPESTVEGVDDTFRIANWLPSRLSFFDKHIGMFSAQHGVVFRMPEAGEGTPHLFLSFVFPFLPFTRVNEIKVALVMLRVAQMRLSSLASLEAKAQAEEDFELRIQEREYELGALVHEINNTVQDLTLLCESMLEAQVEETISGIDAQRGRFNEQIERIVILARSVATVMSDAKRRRELEKMRDLRPRELIEVTQAVREIVSFASIRAERKRISVIPPKLPDERVMVRVSLREHFETILRNLLHNAIKYSDPGSEVKVIFEADASLVRIDIVDNGPGLSIEEQENVFRSGVRGASASGKPGGLGLGLSESRRVAEAAGGSVEVYSAGVGMGSAFTVRIPRQSTNIQESEIGPWALLVDDQPSLTEFYAKLARALQFSPRVANSVADALEIVEALGEPTFVVTDIHLGASSGLELVKQLRIEFGTALPILVVSGVSDDDIVDQVREVGATDFVRKPVSRRALFARIQSILPQNSFE